MSPPRVKLTDSHRRELGRTLKDVLTDIRNMTDPRQITDLADAFHNLPGDMWEPWFDLETFRNGELKPYCDRHPSMITRGWLGTVDRILGQSPTKSEQSNTGAIRKGTGIRRVSAQKSQTLRETYEQFAFDPSSATWLNKSARQILELLDHLEPAIEHLCLYAMTSHAELKLLSADDCAATPLVAIVSDHGDGITVRFSAPENLAPWPGAIIEGIARSPQAAIGMIEIALQACGLPARSDTSGAGAELFAPKQPSE